MPFVFLLVGLLGGGLVCLLVLNTILASGSFQLTSLQQSNATLGQREQQLQAQIAEEESPGELAAEARKLGMVPASQPHFINLKTGRAYPAPATHGAGR
jgi:cell division protein FtsB